MNWQEIRTRFPIMQQRVHGQPLAYFDHAATTQKPLQVLEAMERYYKMQHANVHRGAHYLSDLSTQAYEHVRAQVATFLHAEKKEEIIFTKGATEGINLVAQSYVETHLQPGDEIILSLLEHHANIVPWQILAKKKGLILKFAPMIPLDEKMGGTIDVEAFKKMLSSKVKFVSLIHASNVLGSINPIKTLIECAHAYDIPVLVDACQSAPHQSLDVQEMGADFLVFSGHKLCGPMGIGVLYGRYDLLHTMTPYQGGGAMIEKVDLYESTFLPPPHRFEAGTPNVASVVGLGSALSFIDELGFEAMASEASRLTERICLGLSSMKEYKIYANFQEKRLPIISLSLEGAHAHDVALLLDQQGIAVRSGHHCAMPLLEHLGVEALLRVSVAFYNNDEDVVQLIAGLQKARSMLLGIE